MSTIDPRQALDALAAEYARRAEAIRRDLGRSHSPSFAEQAVQRQNDDVLRALLAEAEDGLRQVERARERLAAGRYGECVGCGEPVGAARLAALPAEHLAQMESELLSHMEKEEQVLFPLMIKGGHPMIRHPIAMMRHEHDDHASALAELERLSHGMVPPAGACNSWRSLYQGLAQLRDDLQQHIRLENELLFPAFEPASQAAGGCGGGHCGCGG